MVLKISLTLVAVLISLQSAFAQSGLAEWKFESNGSAISVESEGASVEGGAAGYGLFNADRGR